MPREKPPPFFGDDPRMLKIWVNTGGDILNFQFHNGPWISVARGDESCYEPIGRWLCRMSDEFIANGGKWPK